jgi:hypothetical protein
LLNQDLLCSFVGKIDKHIPMRLSKDELLALVRKGARSMSWQEKLRLTVLLSLPAMVAQISSVAMQIIDAAKESGDGSLIRKQHLGLKIEEGLPES